MAALLALVFGACALFAVTVLDVAPARNLALPLPRAQAMTTKQGTSHGFAHWLPKISRPKSEIRPISVGFYVPGDDASIASLRRHIYSLDWIVPATIELGVGGRPPTITHDIKFDRMIAAMSKHPKVLPMVQNFTAGRWDGAGAAATLANIGTRARLIESLSAMVRDEGKAGLVIDIEALPESAQGHYLAFLRQLKGALPAGSQLAVTVPSDDASWPIAKYAQVTDRVILMAYDQHWEDGPPGPIAGQDWFVSQVSRAVGEIGRDKIIVALGSYGYDWHGGDADALSIEDAWLAAHDSDAQIKFDPASGNATFAYDEDGERHTIWMLDAATTWNQMLALKNLGINNIALWRLGSEDSDFWTDLAAWRGSTVPNLSQPRALLNADVEGSGEILRITNTPTVGKRSVVRGPGGILVDESYAVLPTPYVVRRSGAANPKLLALTFDDGPDGTWTPQILDVLEAAHVPATFFVIGENSVEFPGLLKRILRIGGEIGNHTFTHPNLATVSSKEARVQFNLTERIVEAYTGRRMTLFRAPYFGDAEPTTTDELGPALEAQHANYTIVGLHVDPNDWQRPGADAIVRQVVDQVHAATPDNSANVILLHDGGGDRSQTVAALPKIISTLRGQGYRFVPVSQLVGASVEAAMPPIPDDQLWAVRTDAAAFLALAAVLYTLTGLFYFAIALGIARAVTMATLAWVQSRRRRPDPPQYVPSVSVIIPAFNEEKVIVSSVNRVLASNYPGLQVMVVDDGSKDRTSEVVTLNFADEPRVTLLTLVNSGKAAALNQALQQCDGEIVIALDADTQFEPVTIGRLARWFADPRIGAIAGDARVGNRVNLVTRWQAVEYITSQNLERRALAGFDAMTVVPGAVGAWRREALASVGGYPEDTLAEDQDLTIAIQRAGWRVTFDPTATAWTEAPENFRSLARQRYRWAFGTLQCLWKHRAIVRRGRPIGLAFIGLPQAWLFQILFASISPLIDLALVLSIVGTAMRVSQHGWAQTAGDVGTMSLYWIAFTMIDVICGWIAYRLDGHRARYPAHLLIAQRLIYRQIMYWVVIRAMASAVGGWVVGWGKQERSGRVGTLQAESVPD